MAAIYILSRQLAASEYSSHALSTFRQEGSYKKIVTIFGTSILIDLVAVATINIIHTNLIFRIIAVSATMGFGIVSFVLLYSIRDEFLDHINVENIEGNIKNGINSPVWRDEISKDTGFPFYQYFETTRSAIRNDDRQAAYTVFENLLNEISSNIDADISNNPYLTDDMENGYRELVNEIKTVGITAAEEDYVEILPPLIEWLNTVGEQFSRLPSPLVSDKAINSVSSIQHKLIPTNQLDSVGTGVWWGYNKVLTTSAELDQQDPIRSGTYAIGDLIAIASNEHEEFDVDKSRYSIVVQILLSQFMDAWNQHAEEYLSDITVDDILYGDAQFMEPGEFEHNHNYFEDIFKSVSTHITSAERESPLPMSGFSRICDTIVNGVGNLAKTASDNNQLEIVEYYLLVAVLVAHGFGDFTRSTSNVKKSFEEIYRYNESCQDCFEYVINICKENDRIREQRAYFHYIGALAHQDDDHSELKDFAEELEDSLCTGSDEDENNN